MERKVTSTRSQAARDSSTNDVNQFSVLDNDPVPRHFDQSRDPYYIGNGDHPSASLVPKILTGSDNYNAWRRSMIVALSARNKIQFVNGKLQQQDEDHDIWNRCNDLVISWLLHSISIDIADSFMYKENAAEIRDDLQERVHQKNAPRVFEAKRSMQMLSQGSLDVTAYFTRRKALWDLIQQYRPIPACNCGAMKIVQEYQEEDKVMEFLIGLNESYGAVRSQILMQDPLPAVNKAYASVIQEERQRSITAIPNTVAESDKNASESSGATGDQFAGSATFNRSKVTCHHCGMLGHIMEGQASGHDGQSGQCNVPNQDLIQSLTNQYQQLMSLLSQKPQETPKTSPSLDQPLVSQFSGKNFPILHNRWIIDTRATHHVCPDLSLFTNIKKSISLSTVNLPNNACVRVNCVGNIQLSPDIILMNVLHVPDFRYNLLSAPSLIKSIGCHFNFSLNHCIIQDSMKTRTIGMGDRNGDLYYLNLSHNSIPAAIFSVISDSTVVDDNVWHYR
ncbi:retrovirus-related Pol polyprotein from transposon RE1 [Cannabis sativa]|uniref:retrovirus-related Pol polyprotein from transposon RE1 n=1 Tax=Cannabis sativa TaxID=3483 RepID=UPI0029C9F23B|nr:retrovirus-related Pol polyprotein from transposon RE1 [Cannabis sativa]